MAAPDAFPPSFMDSFWEEGRPITRANVLDFFAKKSPHYDPTCINERVRYQGLDATAVRDVEGTQFVLSTAASDQPNLFLIERQLRARGTREVVAVYYVLEGVIFEAPNFYSLFNSRLEKIATHIAAASSYLEQARSFPVSSSPGGKHFSADTTAIDSVLDTAMCAHQWG